VFFRKRTYYSPEYLASLVDDFLKKKGRVPYERVFPSKVKRSRKVFFKSEYPWGAYEIIIKRGKKGLFKITRDKTLTSGETGSVPLINVVFSMDQGGVDFYYGFPTIKISPYDREFMVLETERYRAFYWESPEDKVSFLIFIPGCIVIGDCMPSIYSRSGRTLWIVMWQGFDVNLSEVEIQGAGKKLRREDLLRVYSVGGWSWPRYSLPRELLFSVVEFLFLE